MKRTAAVMLLIILLAAGCADAGTYAGTDAGAHTIFEIRAYRKYVL